MDKLIYTGDQDELLKAASGQLWHLIDSEKHVKQAASSVISEKMIRDNMPDQKHFGTHWIAMGAGEEYGPNKNCDHFPKAALSHKGKDYGYETFLDGYHFREHNNRDPKKAIGIIKASCYNPDMNRVELITWTDKRKGEKEYESVKAGKARSGSMSCRVKNDRCSICGNLAKSSRVYCDDLKNGMGKWNKAHQKFAFAFNDEPVFFDFSDVANPADRIAHRLEYLFNETDMQKAASDNGSTFLFSDLQAKLAGVNLPPEVSLGYSTASGRKWMEKLAEVEDFIQAFLHHPDNVAKTERYEFLKESAPHAFTNDISDETLKEMRKLEPDVLFRILTKSGTVLPFLPFYAYVTGKNIKEASEQCEYIYAREKLLPSLFQDALNNPSDPELESFFIPADSIKVAAYCPEDPVQKLLDEVGENHTVKQPRVNIRILHICATHPHGEKQASKYDTVASILNNKTISRAKIYANAYALYKVAFVQSASEICQENIVDDPSLLLITYQNQI